MEQIHVKEPEKVSLYGYYCSLNSALHKEMLPYPHPFTWKEVSFVDLL